MRYQKLIAFAAAASTATTLACSQASTPTSPTSASPGLIAAGPDGSSLKTTAPGVVSPAGGVQSDLAPELVINNASSLYVSGLPLSYVFEVMNQAGTLVYRSNPVAPGTNGRTAHKLPANLANEQNHTWKAYAVYKGQRGPMSAAASFRTLSRFGVSCAPLGNPVAIVACRLEQHGGMDHDEVVEFLKEVAYDLNQTGISDHGGFGILVKTEGNNCNGYSCDIICEGNGPNQNQYDILIDDQFANFADVQNPTVRPCEIIQ